MESLLLCESNIMRWGTLFSVCGSMCGPFCATGPLFPYTEVFLVCQYDILFFSLTLIAPPVAFSNYNDTI